MHFNPHSHRTNGRCVARNIGSFCNNRMIPIIISYFSFYPIVSCVEDDRPIENALSTVAVDHIRARSIHSHSYK